MARILVVDDEESMRDLLEIILRKEGHKVDQAPEGMTALKLAEDTDYDLVIHDLRMPGMHGLDLLTRLKEGHPALGIVVVTAHGTWENAVEAMRRGAYDYIKKPFDNDQIRLVVSRALTQKAFSRRDGDAPFMAEIVGNTPSMSEIFDIIERVAVTDSTVLIQGESGTGKELVARAIHYGSMRAERPFLSVNCGAFPESLLESELFGHLRGTFTGAISDKRGLFQVADRGTLFLDEIGDISAATQVKLLRVLEERQFFQVGGTEPVTIDVRFLCATNKELRKEVQQGAFREDLFYRLNVIPITLPALRERKEDIPLLAGHFIAKYSRRMNRPISGISDQAKQRLIRYHWPGNVRELENVIQRAIALSRSDVITEVYLPGDDEMVSGGPQLPLLLDEGFDLTRTLADIESRYLQMALDRTDGNMTRAAEVLGISFRSIRYKMRKFHLKG